MAQALRRHDQNCLRGVIENATAVMCSRQVWGCLLRNAFWRAADAIVGLQSMRNAFFGVEGLRAISGLHVHAWRCIAA